MSSVTDCSALWQRAYDQIAKDDKRWRRFCRIAQRENLAGFVSNPSAGQASSVAQVYTPSSPADIEKIVNNVQRIAEQNDASVFRKICSSARTSLDRVKDIGTVATAVHPYAAVGWGVVQFLVTAAVKHANVKEFCWTTLPALTSMVHRYQTYYEVYFHHDSLPSSRAELEESLVELFTLIIQFQMASVIAVQSRMERLKMAFRDNESSQVAEDISKQEKVFKELQAVVDRQTDIVRYQDLKATLDCLKSSTSTIESHVTAIEKSLGEIKSIVGRELRKQILDWISPMKYERIHYKDTKTPMKHTGDWILQEDRYRDWRDSMVASTLWLYGSMGSGKSCVAHAVIEDMKSFVKPTKSKVQKLLFYYCDGTDAEGKEDIKVIENILRSLLKQLADSDGPNSLDARILQLYNDDQAKNPLSAGKTSQLIKDLSVSTDELFLIIDGLDECPLKVQRQLIDHLSTIINEAGPTTKLFLSSRNENPIRKGLLPLNPVRINICDHNESPISNVIEMTVGEALKNSLRSLYIDEFKDRTAVVIKTLKENAGGMFRWVTSAFDFLHDASTYTEMGDRLAILPDLEDLYDLYKVIYSQNMEKARKSQNDVVVKTALMFLLHGQAMLESYFDLRDATGGEYGSLIPDTRYDFASYAEGPQFHIREACSFAKTGKIEATYSLADLAELCKSFICVKDSDQSLYIPHSSVREYLTGNFAEYAFACSHGMLAALCMNVFVERVATFEKRIDPDPYDNDNKGQSTSGCYKRGLSLYAGSHWFTHLQLHRLGHSSDSELVDQPDFKATQSRFLLSQALSKFLCGAPAPEPFQLWSKWMRYHRTGFHPSCYNFTNRLLTEPASTIYARIALNLEFDPAEFQTQGLLNVKEEDMTRCGNGYMGNHHQYCGSTLHFAGFCLATDTVKRLVRYGLDIDTDLNYGRFSALHWPIIRFLSSDISLPSTYCTPAEMINLLLDLGADAEEGYEEYPAPLYLLENTRYDVEKGDVMQMLEAFLRAGVSPLTQSYYDDAPNETLYGRIRDLLPSTRRKIDPMIVEAAKMNDEVEETYELARRFGDRRLMTLLVEQKTSAMEITASKS